MLSTAELHSLSGGNDAHPPYIYTISLLIYAITSIGGHKVKLIDSPGFCDEYVPKQEHMNELGNTIMLVRERVHAIGLVLSAGSRYTGSEATMLRELEHFGELWPYIFILFTKASALAETDGIQRLEYLPNP